MVSVCSSGYLKTAQASGYLRIGPKPLIQRFIVTGCYDGVGRLWKEAGSCTHVLKGHTNAVTSVCVIKPKGVLDGGDELVATASKDRTVRFWKIDADEILEQPKSI
nr:ribosome biogenesis protein WDR12 homolog [Ipomoea batatas]